MLLAEACSNYLFGALSRLNSLHQTRVLKRDFLGVICQGSKENGQVHFIGQYSSIRSTSFDTIFFFFWWHLLWNGIYTTFFAHLRKKKRFSHPLNEWSVFLKEQVSLSIWVNYPNHAAQGLCMAVRALRQVMPSVHPSRGISHMTPNKHLQLIK